MRRRILKMAAAVAVVFLVVLQGTGMALANAAEPPALTILVSGAPEDLTMYLALEEDVAAGDALAETGEDGLVEAVQLQSERKNWETYYRFYYHDFPNSRELLENAVLLTASDEMKSLEFPLDAGDFQYNAIMTLNLEEGTLTAGQPAMRVPLLVAMRVAITLAVEGLIFWLFGYRQKRSWTVFFLVNLVTQTCLNGAITGPNGMGYWGIALIVYEVGILAVEVLVYMKLLKEQSRTQAATVALVANLFSLAAGFWIITNLPV